MLRINGQRAYELLERLAFVRESATEQELKGAHIIADEIRAIGLEPVIESFEAIAAETTVATLEVLEPYQKTYKVTAYKGAECTPEGGVEAGFAYLGSAKPADLIDIKGKLCIGSPFMDEETFKKVKKAGAVALVDTYGTINDTVSRDDLVSREVMAYQTGLPMFTIHTADAQEIVRRKATKVRFELQQKKIAGESRNVVAEIRGTDYPDEIVTVGAHMDSVPYSTGVYDDASGCVVITELMRYFVANPSKRTVRFCYYGSEETGLYGSKAYLVQHKDELDKHIFTFQMDVGGAILGTERCTVSATQCVVDFMKYLADIEGHAIDVRLAPYSGDATPHAAQGIPGVTFSRSGAMGASYIHNRFDVMDFISADALASTGDFMLTFTEKLVNAVIFPAPKKIADSVQDGIKKQFAFMLGDFMGEKKDEKKEEKKD